MYILNIIIYVPNIKIVGMRCSSFLSLPFSCCRIYYFHPGVPLSQQKNLSLRIHGGSIWPFSVELLSKQNMLGKCFEKTLYKGTMTPNLVFVFFGANYVNQIVNSLCVPQSSNFKSGSTLISRISTKRQIDKARHHGMAECHGLSQAEKEGVGLFTI